MKLAHGIALAGFGYWGPNLARNLAALAGPRFRYVIEPAPARAEEARRAHPAATVVDDLDRALADDDVAAVVIATPAATQPELVRRTLAAGRHVFVEKPLALSLEEAVELAETADGAGLALMVGHTFEFVPAVTWMREQIEAGAVGDVLHLHSQRLDGGRIRTDINAFWSIGPHDVSIANYLLDADPEWVAARGGCSLQDGIEDYVFATVGYPGGVLAHMHVSWLDPVKTRRTTVVGSEQMIFYDDLRPEAKLTVTERGARALTPPPGGRPAYPAIKGTRHVPQLPGDEPLALELAHFLDCVDSGARPRTDGWNGVRVVAVLEAVEASLRADGTPVPVPLAAAAR